MTDEDAAKVAEVLSSVDGGCIVCIENAAEEMGRHFPEYDWEAMATQSRGWPPEPILVVRSDRQAALNRSKGLG